jgi:hypothetical protein
MSILLSPQLMHLLRLKITAIHCNHYSPFTSQSLLSIILTGASFGPLTYNYYSLSPSYRPQFRILLLQVLGGGVFGKNLKRLIRQTGGETFGNVPDIFLTYTSSDRSAEKHSEIYLGSGNHSEMYMNHFQNTPQYQLFRNHQSPHHGFAGTSTIFCNPV